MNYEDHFRESDHTGRLDDDDDLSDEHYHTSFTTDRGFHSNNLDETPEIASEVGSVRLGYMFLV